MASSVPLVIGRYSLEAPVASGGMATIYLGRQVGDVGFSRLVAIKRLHPHFVHESDFVAMFLDEARLAARVRHPNVVETLDVVHDGDETFIVLEYVDGESVAGLAALLRARGERMPLEVVVKIGIDLCHGLHAAHEARGPDGAPLGIVHRDVSPQNVLVGADGVAHVADFGVALANVRLSQTRTGQVKGKPAYMAPEQLANRPATRASDIYAAGVVLWELCAGRRAYDASKNEGMLWVRVLLGSVPRLEDVAPWVPPALADAVQRALGQKPEGRFASASEMADTLARALAPAPAAAVGAWIERVAAEPLRKRREIAGRLDRGAAPVPVAIARATPTVAASPSVPGGDPSPPTRAARITPPPRGEHTHTVTSAGPPPGDARSSMGRIAVALVVACATGVGATWLALRGNVTPAAADPPAHEGPSGSEAVPPPTPPASVAEAPAAPSASIDERAPLATLPTASAPEAPKPRRASARPARPGSSAPHPCDPPWFIDAEGIRKVKRECF